MNSEEEYVPGKCNLGTMEIKKRKAKALIAIILTLIIIVLFQVFHADRLLRLLIALPLGYSVICYLQARVKFCVVFGIMGYYNFSNIKKVSSVTEKEFRRLDRISSWKIILVSAAVVILVVVIYFYLPV